MARNAQVGILITAKDSASAVVKGVGSSVSALSTSVGASARIMSAAPVVLNQAFGLARRMYGMIDQTIGNATRTAMEFREKSDPMVRGMSDLARESDLVKARLGDALLPVIVGLGRGITEATGKTSDLIKENRKLIATKVLDFVAALASGLITGVATGTIAVARAWQGWRMIVGVIQAAVNVFFEQTLRGIGWILDRLGALGRIPGLESFAASLGNAADTTRLLADEFGRSADAAVASTEESSRALDGMERNIRAIETASRSALANGVAKAQKLIAESTAGANTKLEDQKKALEAIDARKAIANKLELRSQKGLAEVQDANEQRRIEATNKQIEAQEAARAKAVDTAMAVGQVWGQAFTSMATDSKNAAKIMLEAIISSVEKVVMAYAAEASAAAFKANAGIPVVGLAVATAAAGVAFGLVRAMLSQIPAAATGGTVMGGTPGKDSVLSMLMPGEVVFDTKRASVIDRIADAFDFRQPRMAMAGSGGGGSNVININSHNFFSPTAAETKRQARDAGRVLKRFVR